MGQGTFQAVVLDAYGRQCAIAEKGVPALDAAHIRPFAYEPKHELTNGLLPRSEGCNGRKGDRLVAVEHLRRGSDRNEEHLYELPRRFDQAGLPHDRGASLRITRWAYEQVARVGGKVWVERDVLVPLGGEWEGVLAGG